MEFKPKHSSNTFTFGDGSYDSRGSLIAYIPTPLGNFLNVQFDIVDADIPMLLGLDILDETGMFPNTVTNELVCVSQKWSLRLTRQFGHAYLKWKSMDTFFTRKQLVRMHRHFHHPSTSKLMNLIKKAKPAHADENTRKLLEDISKSCKTCQAFSKPPERFKVSLPPSDIVFNREVAIDLMWLDKRAVLHVVDTETHFNGACFLKGQTVEDVWNAFVLCWSSLYHGYPDKIRADQGSCFTSVRWKRLCGEVGTETQLSGVESHNSIGSGERYHKPLRRIFNKINMDSPGLDREMALRIALKSINDTMGPEGLVPSLLVFGSLPRFPCVNSTLPNQRERMRALEVARAEMSTVTSELRIRKAMLSKVPRNADLVLNPGDMVRVFRETDRKYLGPYPVIRVDGKQVFILINDKEIQHSIHQVLHASEYDKIANGELLLDEMKTMFSSFISRPLHESNDPYRIHITEVLHPADPRAFGKLATEAKKKEIEGLIRKGTWKIVLKEEVPRDANVLTSHFVITIKDVETNQPIFKARYVIHGHKDKEKDFLVHNTTNIQQSSIRTIVCLAAVMGFMIWSHDVSQAYLQSAEKLLREVYLKPSKEFELSSNELLQLLRPLYGLADSGDYWGATFSSHIKNDLGMTATVADMSMFFKLAHNKLCGLMGTFVDDSLLAGSEEFLGTTDLTLDRFESKKRELNNFRFAGIYLKTLEDGFYLNQRSYIDRLSPISLSSSFEQFRSTRAQLTWVVHTRPEICAVVNMMAQVTEKLFAVKYIKLLNKTINKLKESPDDGIKMQRLDRDSLYIKVYSDASFANNPNLSSQLGYIVLLCDKFERCNILHFTSYKSRRIVRSVLGAEVYAMADAFDYAFTLKQDLEIILNQKVPLRIITDSKSLFDIITKNSSSIEKRLMIDIKSVRHGYESMEISDIGFARSTCNPADAFTKITVNEPLTRIVKHGKADMEVERWVVRKENDEC
ncbi:MAG: reverse transcriptase domain-containing protein [Chlamydiota bacterium]